MTETYEKRTITPEDIAFLKCLQTELNTQDHVCQADPRFWVVVTEEKEPTGAEYADGCDLYDSENLLISDVNPIKLAEYFKKEFADQLKSSHISIPKKWYGKYNITASQNNEDTTLYDCDDLLSYLDCRDIINSDDYRLCYYRTNSTYIQPNTMFLTLREAQEHIKLNHYHYRNPRPYAMTAWRSPQVEKLYDILHNVEFEKLI